jgi:hypothetical protein
MPFCFAGAFQRAKRSFARLFTNPLPSPSMLAVVRGHVLKFSCRDLADRDGGAFSFAGFNDLARDLAVVGIG